MQAKTERFEMRLDQTVLDKVDRWRAVQNDVPSRAEAMRRLLEEGLAMTSDSPLKFRDSEKLTVLMICEIYKHLKIKSEINPLFVEAAIHGGHYWGLKWQYPGIFHSQEDKESVVSEVVNILDMWSFVEGAYGRLSKKDKDQIAKEAPPFGRQVVFRGFDGNNETTHLSIAGFLVDDLKRFSVFKDRDLNSHMPMIETHRRMLRVFEPVRRGLVGGNLSASQIIDLLKAMGSG